MEFFQRTTVQIGASFTNIGGLVQPGATFFLIYWAVTVAVCAGCTSLFASGFASVSNSAFTSFDAAVDDSPVRLLVPYGPTPSYLAGNRGLCLPNLLGNAAQALALSDQD